MPDASGGLLNGIRTYYIGELAGQFVYYMHSFMPIIAVFAEASEP